MLAADNSKFEYMEPKYLTALRRKLNRKEYGEQATTPLRRGRSQQATPTTTPNQKPSSSIQEIDDKEANVADSEQTGGQKKRSNKRGRPPSTTAQEPESKRKVKEDDGGRPLRSQQKQNETTTGSRRQASGGTGVQNGGSTRGGTNNHRNEERGGANDEPPYEMLVDDKELKVIKFPGQQENAATYDMVLMLPGISKENVAVECGDFSVRVSIGARDGSNVQNRNNDADGETRNQNGLKSEGQEGSQEIRKYCIVLPEHIVPEATTAEVSPVGRLRIKCVAGESEISENNG
eukprot:TRINITY_DN2039_c0_g1_i5.p1 TRINITY_DN2039_c0_g1~~TRINITY_DN2039_c0_g1_i5.p1  ORF type:complete len:291 (+),score=51.10 TRINITY_DN2039_c0_g1_i5:613-1485(+)